MQLRKLLSNRLKYLGDPSAVSDGAAVLARQLGPEVWKLLRARQGATHLGLATFDSPDCFTLATSDDERVGLDIMDALVRDGRQGLEWNGEIKIPLVCERAGLDCVLMLFEMEADVAALASAVQRFRLQAWERHNRRLVANGRGQLTLRAGYAFMDAQASGPLEELLYRACHHARRLGAQARGVTSPALLREYRGILEREAIVPLYQPIIDFESGLTLGWEAFSRGPENSFFASPQMLFQVAQEAGESQTLERLCRRRALQHLGPLAPGQKLFLNNFSDGIADAMFTPAALMDELAALGLGPSNVVLEFAERQGFKDMALFMRDVERFRAKGFAVAIDDVGTRDSSLRHLAQIRPDYLKFDLSLVDGIDTNPYHRTMVETMLFLAQRIGAKTIAVGIETETAFSSLVSLGVHAGQGNHIGRPVPSMITPEISVPHKAAVSSESVSAFKCATPIVDLAQPCPTAPESMTVKEYKEMLADKPAQSSVVVVRDGRPLGLLMQYNTDRQLSTQFGWSLYYHREVTRLMDNTPLIVDGNAAIEDVARLAMARDATKVYDDILVTVRGILRGVVSVQRMLDRLTQTQVELAKGANPLSGLPGNVSIEREIERRVAAGLPSSMVYVDLDNFKVYNDVFGFERGDRIILLTAEVLREAMSTHGGGEDFLGHVGGDDFLAVVAPQHAQAICDHAMTVFAERALHMYRDEDVRRGYIVGKGRDGVERRFPLVSLSIAVLDCRMDGDFSMARLSSRTAEVKKKAKAVEGNSCVREPLLAEKSEELDEVAN